MWLERPSKTPEQLGRACFPSRVDEQAKGTDGRRARKANQRYSRLGCLKGILWIMAAVLHFGALHTSNMNIIDTISSSNVMNIMSLANNMHI